MRRRPAALLLALSLTAPATTAHAAGAAADGNECTLSRHAFAAASCNQSLSWRYDAASGTFSSGGVSVGSAHRGEQVRYELDVRCLDGTMCAATALPCPLREGQPGLMYTATATPVDSSGRDLPGAAPSIENVCHYRGRSVPVAAVEALAHEEIRKRLVSPTVTSAPPGTTLVNLPTIFSTEPQPPPRIDITTPVPGSITATPSYRWDFGDGLGGLGPGIPYQRGDRPSRDPGKYLHAVYASTGTKHVTLTVTWAVTFRLEGVTEVALAPIVFTAWQDKPVMQARAVLINP